MSYNVLCNIEKVNFFNEAEIKLVMLTSQEYYADSGQPGAKAIKCQAAASMLTDLLHNAKQER